MENEIEKAIEYKKMRDLCAGEFSMYCGGRKCPYFETETCESNRNKTFQESDFNNIAISALEKQKPKEAKENAVQGNCYGCPDCESLIIPCQKYCVNCGQALLWVHTNV
jgi:hypothetical protein